MTTDIFPGERWNHKRTGEQFIVEAIDELNGLVEIRSDRRTTTLTPAQLANLYVFDEDSPDDAPAKPDDVPATNPEADSIILGSAEGRSVVGLISIGRLSMELEPTPAADPPSYFKKEKSKSGRKRLPDVPRYPNGRIKRERYDFLNSNDKLYRQGKAKTK